MGNMTLAILLIVVATGFAVLNGANNGSTLVTIATTSTSMLPTTAIALLLGGIIIGPLLFGTLVARTLASGLMQVNNPLGERTFLIGVLAAMLVIGLLAWRKLPSSLTLATIGGLGGAGIGAGLRVNFTIALLAVAMAIVVPLLTALLSYICSRVLSASLDVANRQTSKRRQLRWFRDATFAIQALAYATNDGQRMLAVLLVALRSGWHENMLSPLLYIALACAFGLGTILGTTHMAGGTPSQLASADSFERSVASVTASIAAFTSSTVGIPVSMTQTTSAALVGAHGSRGMYRVRWEEATKLLSAWALTLPASAALGACGALALRWAK